MKFVLHGGATRDEKLTESNRAFFREMAKDYPSPRVLLVYFAREPLFYEELRKNEEDNFRQASPEKIFTFILASVENFERQAKNADVIYIRGGDIRKLIDGIDKIPNFIACIRGRTYGGSSAGANAIAKYFYSTKLDRVMRGLGIIPINSFPHWEESKQDKLKLLESAGEGYPIYKLKEGEFAVLDFNI